MTRFDIIELFKAELTEKQLPLRLFAVDEMEDHFLITVCGGNNGHPDWPQYLRSVALLMEGHDWWLVDITNDRLDDLHSVTIGVEK